MANFDSHDLRQAGTAAKRAYNHKAKWAYGGRSARCRADPLACTLPITRPAKPLPSSWNRRERTRATNHLSTAAKVELRNDVREALDAGASDSSGVDDYDGSIPSTHVAENLQDADDALQLYEVSGQTIFKDVVGKAVERFETKETEKLIKEYEIITRESEISNGYLADDDDFEIIDRVHL